MVTFIILQLQLGKSEGMYWQDYKDYYNNFIALAASHLELKILERNAHYSFVKMQQRLCKLKVAWNEE